MLTPFPTGTDVSETIGGKEHSRALLKDPTGADAMGAVAASPAANTLLGRLKAIFDEIVKTNGYVDGLEGFLDGVEALLGTNNASTALTAPADDIFAITPADADLPTIPKALLCTVSGNLAVRGTTATTVTFPVVAGQIIPIRARRVMAATTATVVGLA